MDEDATKEQRKALEQICEHLVNWILLSGTGAFPFLGNCKKVATVSGIP
jgi:hypothetical protein